MHFGKTLSTPTLTMYGKTLEFVHEYKYLGIVVTDGKKFSVSHVKPLIKFRSAANTVLNVHRQPSEHVLMKLLFTVCVPIVTYSCEADLYTAKQKNAFNIALNDAIRRIFSYNRWESVRFLRLLMGYPSFTDICYRRGANFLRNIPLLGNPTLNSLILLI